MGECGETSMKKVLGKKRLLKRTSFQSDDIKKGRHKKLQITKNVIGWVSMTQSKWTRCKIVSNASMLKVVDNIVIVGDFAFVWTVLF